MQTATHTPNMWTACGMDLDLARLEADNIGKNISRLSVSTQSGLPKTRIVIHQGSGKGRPDPFRRGEREACQCSI
jgi:hypothetical protein